MVQEIYGDILFAVNFSMDFLALYMTAGVTHTEKRRIRLISAAAVGGAYSVVELVTDTGRVFGVLIAAAVALLMCYISFAPAKLGALLKETAIFCAVNFLLGGCMTVLYTVIGRWTAKRIVVNGESGVLYGEVSAAKFVPLALAAALIAFAAGKIFSSSARRREVSVRLVFGREEIGLTCLADSGDLLCEPAGGLPVIVTCYEKVEKLLPLSLRKAYRGGNISGISGVSPELLRRVRIIPVQTAAGGGVMPGFVPDRAVINGENKRVCVGIDRSESRDGYGGCDAIIPTSLL
ncbi:MAG: sigma-E processing peptidase SpoIIGA [Clostridia bacterium]|nr:sigma-E processing peptidase SpoIIGA [Clostridia bacterium]